MAKFEELEIVRWDKGEMSLLGDDVVVESSLDLVLNDRNLVTLMCSPEDRRVLALGYLKSEGIIEGLDDVTEISFDRDKKSIELIVGHDSFDPDSYFERKRTLTSSCGKASAIIENLEDLQVGIANPEEFPRVTKLTELMKGLQKKAELFRKTGGSHTAALANTESIEYLSEDIGRHNAIDKVIGKAVVDGRGLEELTLLTSGRLSSEMVLKGIRSSIPVIVSRSAPTTLAVRMGRLTGIVMVGFVRGNRLSVYSGEDKFDR